jgi:hypothetical protein
MTNFLGSTLNRKKIREKLAMDELPDSITRDPLAETSRGAPWVSFKKSQRRLVASSLDATDKKPADELMVTNSRMQTTQFTNMLVATTITPQDKRLNTQ